MLGIILVKTAKSLNYVTSNEGCGHSDRSINNLIYCANDGCGSLATMHKISNLIHKHRTLTGSTISLRLSVPLCDKCYETVNKDYQGASIY